MYMEDSGQLNKFSKDDPPQALFPIEKTKLFYQLNAVRLMLKLFEDATKGQKIPNKSILERFEQWFNMEYPKEWLVDPRNTEWLGVFDSIESALHWPTISATLGKDLPGLLPFKLT
jgi:hypothetical protein